MIYSSSENRKDYFPPLLGNGDIALWADREGSVCDAEERTKGIQGPKGCVFRAGRRTAFTHTQPVQGVLMQWGSLHFSCSGTVCAFTQELDPVTGTLFSHCDYESGRSVDTVCFVHPQHNLYAVQKTFHGDFPSVSLELILDQMLLEELRSLKITAEGSTAKVDMKVRAYDSYRAGIWLASTAGEAVAGEDRAVITHSAADGDVVCYYYLLEDSLYDEQFPTSMVHLEKHILDAGFSSLLEENQSIWRAYHNEGFVHTGDGLIDATYATAMYHLKCYTTRWSIPVGLCDICWQGKYFAFDEYTSYLGLLGANRLELAKRVPLYRVNKCLDTAIKRASDCHRNPETEDMARFHWETGENDRMELSPDGNWLDHVFHIPLVGIGAFNYYEYSEDIEFLKDCYKLIRACSKFITKHMLYRDGEKFYIGKCTDLERLGSSVQNPFMTVCGSIKLLECCSKSAEILGIDKEYAEECKFISEKLRENLPQTDEMYVPYLNCKQKSIAVFSCKFPFDVLPHNDNKMLNAWDDFEINGGPYGNMYPGGSGISPWYACWKASGYARAKLTEKAYYALKQSYRSVGVFDEMFEINEETFGSLPWFATAAGIFISTVNDMLLQCNDNMIDILPAFPNNMDVSFKLAAKGGITVEAVVKNDKLLNVVVMKNGKDVTDRYVINFHNNRYSL